MIYIHVFAFYMVDDSIDDQHFFFVFKLHNHIAVLIGQPQLLLLKFCKLESDTAANIRLCKTAIPSFSTLHPVLYHLLLFFRRKPHLSPYRLHKGLIT